MSYGYHGKMRKFLELDTLCKGNYMITLVIKEKHKQQWLKGISEAVQWRFSRFFLQFLPMSW